jgi:hypothetical protein
MFFCVVTTVSLIIGSFNDPGSRRKPAASSEKRSVIADLLRLICRKRTNKEREMSSSATYASSVAKWRPALARIFTSATVVALVMSYVGGFALDDDPALVRTLYVLVASWLGAVFDMLAYALALRLGWTRDRFWTRVLAADFLVSVPLAVLLWASTWLFGSGFGLAILPLFFLNSFIVTGVFIATFVAPAMDTVVRRASAVPSPELRPANFMDRLPGHLHGSELWALKADDHYLQVLTSRGETLLRLRMADALRELVGINGAQAHRSWWVARTAVRGVRRGAGSVALVLPDGKEVPVSRSAARTLRAAGWY